MEEELLEQEFLERCFQEMLEEEDQDWFIPSRDLNSQGVGQLQQQLNGMSVNDHHGNLEEVAVRRTLHTHAHAHVRAHRTHTLILGCSRRGVLHCGTSVRRVVVSTQTFPGPE